ncbi:nucleoside deaminase [Geomicrobium sediminis]|uniref:tRNA(Arg) A34 adenosine deaminase TadA n=1 Tax=Geomicrobium sediminis TaxID=1347788 RepID=A0ABS2PBV0_9BACL|nr:nucleoside deaminase [Geomicrobium sediminis]MBM7632777.1 tRNA(Arg) A34 adenosine deaminase TadA [Geomicrobium sediminis]
MITKQDYTYLERCVELTAIALEEGNEPFGSLLVSENGDILFEDYNKISSGDPTKHPEFAIAQFASIHLSELERHHATVYTSGEHCPMCASAHGLAGLGRIVYASSSVQLREWRKEWGQKSSNLKPLAIQDVLVKANVDGPVLELSEQIKSLHLKRRSRE